MPSMKKSRMPMALSLLLVALLAASAARLALAQGQGASGDFSASKAFQKLDADTQKAWQDAMQANDPSRRIDCFVRVRAPADRGDQSFLVSNGFVVRMFSGNTASGYLAAKDLPNVARLDFVDAVRIATK
jgi:hypothetical protein